MSASWASPAYVFGFAATYSTMFSWAQNCHSTHTALCSMLWPFKSHFKMSFASLTMQHNDNVKSRLMEGFQSRLSRIHDSTRRAVWRTTRKTDTEINDQLALWGDDGSLFLMFPHQKTVLSMCNVTDTYTVTTTHADNKSVMSGSLNPVKSAASNYCQTILIVWNWSVYWSFWQVI